MPVRLSRLRTAPWRHQEEELVRSCSLAARALLWQPRTGKTKVVVDTSCHLHEEEGVRSVVVLAPNGVHENWTRREFPAHAWAGVDLSSAAWHTRDRETDEHREAIERVISHKGLSVLAISEVAVIRPDVKRLLGRFLRRKGRKLLSVDESQGYRKPGAHRTKTAMALARHCDYRRILTGSPVTNSPLAAWSQFQIIKPGALGFDKYSVFEERYARYKMEKVRKGRSLPRIDGYQNLDELRDRMAPWSSVVLRSDCEDLPAVLNTVRTVTPSDEQLRLYRELQRKYVLEIDGKTVTIAEGTVRIGKLQQVLSGFLVDEYGDVHDVPGPNPRLEALSDEVLMTPGKCIVWCQYQEDLRRVAARLRADGVKFVEYHGRVHGNERRQQAVDEFNSDPTIDVFLGQPQAGGAGWNLSAHLCVRRTECVIWYSHTFDAIVREQARERATMVGGQPISEVDLVAPGADEYIRDNVAAKISVADGLSRTGLREVIRRIAL